MVRYSQYFNIRNRLVVLLREHTKVSLYFVYFSHFVANGAVYKLDTSFLLAVLYSFHRFVSVLHLSLKLAIFLNLYNISRSMIIV